MDYTSCESVGVSTKTGQLQALGKPTLVFAPAVLLADPTAAARAEPASSGSDVTAMVVEIGDGTRVTVGSHASAALVTAALRALR